MHTAEFKRYIKCEFAVLSTTQAHRYLKETNKMYKSDFDGWIEYQFFNLHTSLQPAESIDPGW